jgi:hypothetical protein
MAKQDKHVVLVKGGATIKKKIVIEVNGGTITIFHISG